MRHKYETRGIVLSRSPVGEASTFITLLTPELGLVRALSQGVRKSGAKLAASLTTFAESDVVLVRGKDGWRLAGAVLAENWFARLGSSEPRERAGRVTSLVLRLVAGEEHEQELFPIVRGFFEALAMLPADTHEAVEVLVALRILAVLGLDAGEIPSGEPAFAPELLADILKKRTGYIARINNGIAASGL
ncbi:MAG: recombination protein O N-terminal domain-containing protein [bacterium]|nr:recombination protein O N-terminal domain-containing protein [bacterium]